MTKNISTADTNRPTAKKGDGMRDTPVMDRIGRRELLGLGALTVGVLVAGCTGPSPATPAPAGPATRQDPGGLTGPGASPTTAQLVTADGLPPSDATSPKVVEPPKVSTSGSHRDTSRADAVARYGATAPTSWGLEVVGIVRSLPTRDRVVALTFDACGGATPSSAGSGYDREIIDLLRRHQCRATLFLNARWVSANPRVADELAQDPLFEIGNHGTRHLPLSVTGRAAYGLAGTRSVGEAYDEVAGNHDSLTRLLGHAPRFFRAGTAHCDDVGVRVAGELGEQVVNFTVNGDAGATFSARQVASSLRRAGPGDIVISHLNHPEGQTAEGYAVALPELLVRGLRTVTLGEYLV